jgi:anthranilate/para-aminobenzoate synthase component II
VVKATEPKHGKTDLIYHSNEGIFQNLKSPIRVMRYHSLLLASVVAPFKLLAWTQKHEVMAIGDLAHRAYGVQFHPESILTESGRELIQNWIRLWK